ncbi:hypothetical protein PILCRDRAFT_813925 [Piloderma croceum F 1598]|uniref:Uncharacterized protein n=1 Tax=Piloderma croceum (strain F 1598) TaxID=765440 RepID=A0A0C3GE63_PILCF|nr:hypothetical protein PILCRDRAFT_813925 [Piloderma croceum F 1598]
MTPTITLSRRKHIHDNNFTDSSSFYRPFMSSHDTRRKTSLVSVLALILGLGGFATSLIALCVEWLIPATKAKMPSLDNERINRSGHRIRSISRHPHKNAHVQPETLRRHSSFHTGPVSMIGPLLSQRPQHARRVSFNLESSKHMSTPNGRPRKSSSPACPFTPKDLAVSPDASPRSSDSGTLVPSSSSSNPAHDLPVRCYDAKCDCHSRSITPLELDIRPALAFPASSLTSSRQLLGKRLPSMKKAFGGKRRTSSSASTTTMAEMEPGMRSALLRSSLDSPQGTNASIVESDTQPGTAGNTSGDSYRSAFVRPFMPSRSKTMPPTPLVDQEVKSNVAFSNPWLISRNHTVASDASSEALCKPSSHQQSPGRAFIRRFSSSKSSSQVMAKSSDAGVPVERATSMRPKVPRTEPYGPPYNFPVPGEYLRRADAEEPCNTSTESDSVPIMGKKYKKSCKSKSKRAITALSRQYPQDDLLEALDQKLSALQKVQAVGSNLSPKYILLSESDASAEALRSADMFRTQTSWRASIKRRVVSDSRSMIR